MSFVTADSSTSTTANSTGTASTMSSFPVASPSTLVTTSTSAQDDQTATTGLSDSAKDAICATSIIGGTFVIALLAWILYRQRLRRKKARRRRMQQELDATSTHRQRPSGFEDEMTEHLRRNGQSIPRSLADRFRRQDEYAKTTLGAAYPMHKADMDLGDQSSLLCSPPRALTKLDKFELTPPQNESLSQSRPGLSIDPTYTKPSLPEPLILDTPTRWSWTNSQAPATPRMYAPTIRSSQSDQSRMRMAVNWVKTKGERITGGEVGSPLKMTLPKAGILRNHASKPNLAPRKLVKKHSVRRASDLEAGDVS